MNAAPIAAGNAPHDSSSRSLASAIRALLQGADPGSLPQPSAAVYGPWAETMAVLCEAHARGGTAALREAHLAIARLNPQLTALVSADSAPKRTAWTLAELVHTDFLPPEFVVYGLLPVGLSNLAGRPKVGKSLLANQIAVAVDGGFDVLGNRVRQARVFYLALEDSPSRLSQRLKKLTLGRGHNIPFPRSVGDNSAGVGFSVSGGIGDRSGDSKFVISCRLLGEGGLEQIGGVLDEGYGVVVIDTFSRACGRADQNDSADMTMIMGALQRMALDHHAAILLVDHHRKSARTSLDSDPIDDIYGSTAKAGVVDCALGLYRRHNESEGVLKLSGRDFGDAEIPLTWDAETFTWQRREGGAAASSAAPAAHYSERDYEAIATIGELGPSTLTQIMTVTGEAKGNLYNRLAELCKRQALVRSGYGKGTLYCLPQPNPEPEVMEVMDVIEVIDDENDAGDDITSITSITSPAGDDEP